MGDEGGTVVGRLAVIEGRHCAPHEANISVYDRGFLYGDSVFETVRTYGGRLFALDEHLARLAESAHKLGFELPLTIEAMAEEIAGAVAAGANDESYVRVMVTRGTGPLGLDTALAEGPRRVILVEPLKLPPPERYRRGLTAICVETVRASDAADSAKLGNYVASALALKKAREAGAEEALVINRDGLVVEGTTANVFAVTKDGLSTPALTDGILAGITRSGIIACAEALDLPVTYESLTREQIYDVDEVFLTSSIREVIPIVEVDGRKIGSGSPGETTQRLHRAFRERVGLDGRLPFETDAPSEA
jgi:branched-chain amino acid aminotransferase